LVAAAVLLYGKRRDPEHVNPERRAPEEQLELAEHRDRSFVDEAFTETEARLISGKQKEYDVGENMMQTLFFSAKESYLKMKGLGLSVDLRSVQCSEVVKLPNKGGISFDVFVTHDGDERKVQAHVPSAYVLTVCVDDRS